MSKLTKEDIVSKERYVGLTMGKLRDFVSKHPQIKSDTKVVIEHVDNRYFEDSWDYFEVEFELGDTSVFYEGWGITADNKKDLICILSHY